MRDFYSSANLLTIEGVAEPEDQIDVRVGNSITGKVLYIDVNGVTRVRIGHIQKEIEVIREDVEE